MKTVLDHATEQASLYDADFYVWAQEQAALLRQVPRGSFELDIDHLADEVEDMGRSELNKASSLLRQALVHLLKLAILPDSPSREHWLSEVITFQGDARLAFTPGMKQRIELDSVWKAARNGATNVLKGSGLEAPVLPMACPFALDELLAAEFDLGRMLERMTNTLRAAAGNSPR